MKSHSEILGSGLSFGEDATLPVTGGLQDRLLCETRRVRESRITFVANVAGTR